MRERGTAATRSSAIGKRIEYSRPPSVVFTDSLRHSLDDPSAAVQNRVRWSDSPGRYVVGSVNRQLNPDLASTNIRKRAPETIALGTAGTCVETLLDSRAGNSAAGSSKDSRGRDGSTTGRKLLSPLRHRAQPPLGLLWRHLSARQVPTRRTRQGLHRQARLRPQEPTLSHLQFDSKGDSKAFGFHSLMIRDIHRYDTILRVRILPSIHRRNNCVGPPRMAPRFRLHGQS